MHVQAQPVVHWPSLLLCGLVFAVMRMEGVGLIWLIAIHAAYDSLVLWGPVGPESVPGLSFILFSLRGVFVLVYSRRMREKAGEQPRRRAVVPTEEPAPLPPSKPAESEECQRLRRALALAATAVDRDGPYRIRLHIAKVNAAGEERDLGPWPDVTAQVSDFDDAANLCSFFSHHLKLVLFPKGYA
jgi:hypothetical protein